jgi:GAF domain-containing protein
MYRSLQGAPEILEVDNDIAVSMRASRQGVMLAETDVPYRAHLALPMLQGGELKGIVLLGTKRDSQSYRPDEQGVLEFAVGRIGLDLNRLQAAQLNEQFRQVQQELHSVKVELDSVAVELDSLKADRATLMLALSKIGASA